MVVCGGYSARQDFFLLNIFLLNASLNKSAFVNENFCTAKYADTTWCFFTLSVCDEQADTILATITKSGCYIVYLYLYVI